LPGVIKRINFAENNERRTYHMLSNIGDSLFIKIQKPGAKVSVVNLEGIEN
jgi:hypothetical protein